MAVDICVAVAKYSHATGVKPDNTIPWTHIVASNVAIVLKGEDTHIPNGQMLLQVVQGTSALATIDIGELVDRAIEARHGSQQAGITPQIEQLPIFGIHKEVFLALRYRLPDRQARRVQFRLQSAQECSYVVGILERRGMEFQQQRPRTGRPESSRPETSGSAVRPSTTQTYSDTFGVSSVHPKPNPFRLQALEAGGLSSQTLGDVSKTFTADRAVSRQPSSTRTVGKTSFAATGTAPSVDASNARPTLDFGPDTRFNQDVFNRGMEHNRDSATTYQVPSSPAKQGSILPVGNSTSSDSAHAHHSTGLYQPLAPASLRLPDTLEHEMPPRRELPFKRPGSQQSAGSRPSTAAKSTESASLSTAAGDSSEVTLAAAFSPARNISATRPSTASPLKRTIAPSNEEPARKALAVEARPQSHASHMPSVSSSSKSTYITASEGSFRRPSDLGELLRISKPLAERSPNSNNVTRMDSTADAQYELETPPGTSSSAMKTNAHPRVSSPSRPDDRAVTFANTSDKHTTKRPSDPLAKTSSVVAGSSESAESAVLASYASQSREDRQTVLDEFMVSKLVDPNFAILCEDLDSCWRRIALGL